VSDCIFCRIVQREIPAQIVYENDQVVIFKDIQPVAPDHFLAIPKRHINNICDPDLIEPNLLSGLFEGIQIAVDELGLKENGFRTVINFGQDAGEAVHHLHFHIIAGRQLNWPPG
jgi:histidine triad (HIT) family protein